MAWLDPCFPRRHTLAWQATRFKPNIQGEMGQEPRGTFACGDKTNGGALN